MSLLRQLLPTLRVCSSNSVRTINIDRINSDVTAKLLFGTFAPGNGVLARVVWQVSANSPASLVLRRTSSEEVKRPIALRSKKQTSDKPLSQAFVDSKRTRVTAGRGGDGCISFLSLWANDKAGPDGGDGGNGGHILFQATSNVSDLKHIPTTAQAEHGEKGFNKDCNGQNAKHITIPVPIGTIVRNEEGDLLGDLSREGMMFLAARGGAGGRGNYYFMSDTLQAPHVAELGGEGEHRRYILEVKTMANIGLLGMPNAGKSTLLRAISRARPKVAPYPFTTLKPHLGVVQYDDYERVSVADLPGLIEGSHRNRGLGIQFLQHAERCAGLLYVVDMSMEDPLEQIQVLQFELEKYSSDLAKRPLAIVANKMDLPEAQANLEGLEAAVDLEVIPISAKFGTNITALLDAIRRMHDAASPTD